MIVKREWPITLLTELGNVLGVPELNENAAASYST